MTAGMNLDLLTVFCTYPPVSPAGMIHGLLPALYRTKAASVIPLMRIYSHYISIISSSDTAIWEMSGVISVSYMSLITES